MHWRLVVEYDGREFCGWQFQPGVRTVQATMESAARQLFGGAEIRVVAAGRTDAGVHALGQVVGFRTDVARDPERVRLGLNSLLPPDLSVREAHAASPGFHARFSATWKLYRYLVLDRPSRSPFWGGRAWHTKRPLDWAAMDEALALYLGKHNFSAFRGPNCEHRNPERTIDVAQRRPLADGLHAIEIGGPGFLRYQVRIMVGTLLEVGLGRRRVEEVRRALTSTRRDDAGRTALANGLYLVEVRYPPALLLPPSGEGPLTATPAVEEPGDDGED